ncbi:MAG: type II toxin-antitoxin system HicB family antitoxin [Nitrospirae bacterium]|nr:type II toxin-antitoxin system HicB family antitoxin [Nitrospirota bacterium]
MIIRAIIEQDEDGYFTAEVPALPGCFSQGNTHEEAVLNIKEAIAGWLEVMEADHLRNAENVIEVSI